MKNIPMYKNLKIYQKPKAMELLEKKQTNTKTCDLALHKDF